MNDIIMERKLTWDEWLLKKGEKYYKAFRTPRLLFGKENILFGKEKMTRKEFERKLTDGTTKLLKEIFSN